MKISIQILRFGNKKNNLNVLIIIVLLSALICGLSMSRFNHFLK